MSLGSAVIFIGELFHVLKPLSIALINLVAFVYMHVNPADPDPFFMQNVDGEESPDSGVDLPMERERTMVEVELHAHSRDSDSYDTDSTSVGTSPEIGHSVYWRSAHQKTRTSFSI